MGPVMRGALAAAAAVAASASSPPRFLFGRFSSLEMLAPHLSLLAKCAQQGCASAPAADFPAPRLPAFDAHGDAGAATCDYDRNACRAAFRSYADRHIAERLPTLAFDYYADDDARLRRPPRLSQIFIDPGPMLQT